MSSFPTYFALLAYIHLPLFVSALHDQPLGSKKVQHILGDTCHNLMELSEGDDLVIRGGDVWVGGSCYTEVLQEARPSTASSTASLTITPTRTVVDEILATITARATLQARNAEPEPQIASLLGITSADVNSQINAAKSQASVINAQSISQLSARFSASMMNLQSSASSVQSSASSAVSQANVNIQMAMQASSSAKSAADSANSSLMSIQASAASAISAASSQMQSASMSAGLAVSRAQAMVSDANNQAQQQISLSQAQAQAAAKIAVAVVVSVVGTSLLTILGFFLLTRRRNRKSKDEYNSTSRPHHNEKRDSYHSHTSYDDRYPLANSGSRSRSRSSHRKPRATRSRSRSSQRKEQVIIYTGSIRSRSRSPYRKTPEVTYTSQSRSRSISPHRKQEVSSTVSRPMSPYRKTPEVNYASQSRSRSISPPRKQEVSSSVSRPRSPQREEIYSIQLPPALRISEQKTPKTTGREVNDQYKLNDSDFSFNTGEPIFTEQEFLPFQQSISKQTAEPNNNVAVSNNDKRGKYITPTFVSRNTRNAPPLPPGGYPPVPPVPRAPPRGSFGQKPNEARKSRNSEMVDIGLATSI